MRGSLLALIVIGVIVSATTAATAQTVVVMRPPAQVVYSPVIPAYSPVVVQPTQVVTAYSPVVVARPARAVVTYHPFVPPPAVMTYRPLVPSYRAPMIVGAGRPIIVRPKVYIPGQPVRNILRAITP